MKQISPAKIIIPILLFSFISFGQYQHTFKRFFDDGASIFEAPGHWSGKDFIRLAVITGGTYSLLYADEKVKNFAIDNGRYSESNYVTALKYWGEPLTNGLLSAFFLIQGSSADNNENKELGFLIAESYLYTGTITGILKISFGRHRPLTGADAFTCSPFGFNGYDYRSFPSGHTSTSFALSTILASRIDNKILKALIYLPALGTGFSRIYQNQHWLSDVFFGACLGYFIGKHLVDKNEKVKGQISQPTAPPANIVNFSFSF